MTTTISNRSNYVANASNLKNTCQFATALLTEDQRVKNPVQWLCQYIYIPWHKENDCTQLERLGNFDDKDLDWKLHECVVDNS